MQSSKLVTALALCNDADAIVLLIEYGVIKVG
jgi:hypothetical protein